MTDDRDRDGSGRPRSARPRDETGRPLPRGATGAPREPEVLLPPDEALRHGARLVAEGLPFRAHEVFETAWKAAPEGERPVWRGLAQLAVGLTHWQRGNPTGAVALLRRGAELLADAAPPAAGRLDPAAVAVVARRLADLVEAQPRSRETPSARSSSAPSSASSDALAATITELVSSISANASSS